MLLKNILERLGFTWSKNAAGDIVSHKKSSKQKVKAHAPAIVAGGDITAGGNIKVDDSRTTNYYNHKTDRVIAKHIVDFLGDRRLLYKAYESRSSGRVADSVHGMWEFIGVVGSDAKKGGKLEHEIREMCEACRNFLDIVPVTVDQDHEIEEAVFHAALGTLRKAIGANINEMVSRYRLTVSHHLNPILPTTEEV